MTESAKTPKSEDPHPAELWISRLGGGGRVVVPAGLRRELGLKPGDAVVFEKVADQIVVKSHTDVVRALQRKYGSLWKSSEYSTDAFLAERKRLWGEE
jgi:AbrB family looped-hinge helix DNA binding protein